MEGAERQIRGQQVAAASDTRQRAGHDQRTQQGPCTPGAAATAFLRQAPDHGLGNAAHRVPTRVTPGGNPPPRGGPPSCGPAGLDSISNTNTTTVTDVVITIR
jgi:hypothetical protein